MESSSSVRSGAGAQQLISAETRHSTLEKVALLALGCSFGVAVSAGIYFAATFLNNPALLMMAPGIAIPCFIFGVLLLYINLEKAAPQTPPPAEIYPDPQSGPASSSAAPSTSAKDKGKEPERGTPTHSANQADAEIDDE